jgi:hypothetical protein
VSYFTTRLVVCLCTLAAISSSLYAVDGLVLIDQNHALAGNTTPGDAPGFPVTISQPGSYRLTGNLIVPDVNTTAIQVTAENVTIDLNGFSIIGPNNCIFDGQACPQASGVGVLAGVFGTPGPQGVRVLNGTVRGMGSHGIFVNGLGCSVTNVIALGNRQIGIEADSGSVIDSVSSFNLLGILGKIVRGSTAESNGQVGIQVSPNGVAIGNAANSNVTTGLLVSTATATDNTANNNAIGIEALCPGALVGNTAFGNRVGNIITGVVNNGPGCTLANNSQ